MNRASQHLYITAWTGRDTISAVPQGQQTRPRARSASQHIMVVDAGIPAPGLWSWHWCSVKFPGEHAPQHCVKGKPWKFEQAIILWKSNYSDSANINGAPILEIIFIYFVFEKFFVGLTYTWDLTILTIFKDTIQWFWHCIVKLSGPFISRKIFISPNGNCVFIKQWLPSPPSPQPLVATILLSALWIQPL